MYLTVIFFLVIVLPVPIMTGMIAKRETPFRVVLEGAIAAIMGAVLVMILASVSGKPIFMEMQAGIQEMAKVLAENTSLAEAMGIQGESTAHRIRYFTEIYQEAGKLLPSSISIMAAVISYFEYIILSKLYKPKGIAAIPMTPMREFNLPRTAITGWILIYLISWILTSTEIYPNDMLYNNVNVLFDFVFSLQGISVLFYLVYRRNAPRIIAVILMLFFMTTVFGKLVLLILGFADILLGLKKKL